MKFAVEATELEGLGGADIAPSSEASEWPLSSARTEGGFTLLLLSLLVHTPHAPLVRQCCPFIQNVLRDTQRPGSWDPECAWPEAPATIGSHCREPKSAGCPGAVLVSTQPTTGPEQSGSGGGGPGPSQGRYAATRSALLQLSWPRGSCSGLEGAPHLEVAVLLETGGRVRGWR